MTLTLQRLAVSASRETVEIRLLRDGELERTAILAGGELRPSQFAGVAISVPELFPE